MVRLLGRLGVLFVTVFGPNNTLSPGALLASLLNANLNQQLNAYNVVTDFSNSSSNNTFNLLA